MEHFTGFIFRAKYIWAGLNIVLVSEVATLYVVFYSTNVITWRSIAAFAHFFFVFGGKFLRRIRNSFHLWKILTIIQHIRLIKKEKYSIFNILSEISTGVFPGLWLNWLLTCPPVKVRSLSLSEVTDDRLTADEMDERRKENIAYEYLCHLEEAKVWVDAILEGYI